MASDYTQAKKVALKTIIILAGVTVIEVLIALTGRGHLIEGIHWPWWLMNFVMVALSLYKAYLIVGIFMHLKYETKSMMLSVLLPVLLLVWAIIAFMYEGSAWKGNREQIKEKDKSKIERADESFGTQDPGNDTTKELR